MDFDLLVIERSHELPVVVDFWAPWCGPCKVLGPVIEELHAEGEGAWDLVKVNTDDHQDLMNEYGVRGIPAVKLFHKGEITAEFTGALPKYQLEKWLDENIPSALKLTLEEVRDDLNAIRNLVKENPDFMEAKVELASQLVFENAEESAELVGEVRPGHKLYSVAEPILAITQFLTYSDFDERPVSDDLMQAQQAAIKSDHSTAIGHLINSILKEKSFADELARKTTIAYFNWLGPEHEITKKYRRRFDMALY